ncbi:hypothetical protein [uncultured Methanobacterium sp.]|uniref:hypothetical protein n=1 Tax=uncultured Methanobacterium sp. TaxID=176306 RepID=UPI002AA6CB16|nr:hypothetical protein [uncultured Methanobacterium sp.]
MKNYFILIAAVALIAVAGLGSYLTEYGAFCRGKHHNNRYGWSKFNCAFTHKSRSIHFSHHHSPGLHD